MITGRAKGIDFALHTWGEGKHLALLLHGFPDDAGSMQPLGEGLARLGFFAVAPYLRGYFPGVLAIFADNLGRFLAGAPLHNVVDKRLGYVAS
jgi:hypothetical protein